MPELSLFAGLRVADLAAARAWYERLLGEAAFEPNEDEVVWEIAAERFVYVLRDGAAAGNGLVTLFVDDLDARLEAIAARGLEPDEREAYDNGVRKAVFRDPDGNEIGFAGPPAGG